MTRMTVAFKIAQLISFFVVTIEIAESNDVVNVKRFTKDSLGDSATLAGVIIPCPCTAGLPIPILPVVIGVTATPDEGIFPAPVVRFPFGKAFMIAKVVFISGKLMFLPAQDRTTPIATDVFAIVSVVVLASCTFACKRAAITTFTNPKLVACQLAMVTTVGLDFRGFNNLDLAAPLANLLNPMGIVVAFLTTKRLRLPEWFESSATLNTRFHRKNFSHTVIVARLFGYVKQYGSGTVGQVARELGRRFIGIDLSARYLIENALPRSERLTSQGSLNQLPLFAEVKI